MKNKTRKLKKLRAARRRHYLSQSVVGASLIALGAHVGSHAVADDAITPEQWFEGGTNTYNNWLELSTGGLMTKGNANQAQRGQQLGSGAFGGIEDLHYKTDVGKKTTMTVDGRALFDNHDYNINLSLVKAGLGFVQFGFTDFRTWDSGNGGYLPRDNQAYSLPGDAPTLDHGQITFEAGLKKDGIPKINLKYTHRYRNGDKDSTIWGPVHSSSGIARVYPGLYSIDEKSDKFQLDLTHYLEVAKKTVNYGAGVAYEWGKFDDQHKLTFWSGEPIQQKVTDKQGTSFGMLNTHVFAESWIKDNLFLSTAFSYANLDDTFTGYRAYADDFGIAYSSAYPALGMGYYSLNGGSHKNQYVENVNLFYKPTKTISVIPSVRIKNEDWNADSTGIGTLYNPGAGQSDTQPFKNNSGGNSIDVTEQLDLRYTGVTNWVFSTRGEWTEGQGTLNEHGGLTQVNGFGPLPVKYATDTTRLFQKYSVNARWYPVRQATLDLGGYYKLNKYNWDNSQDNTPDNGSTGNAYPGFITYQGLETWDGSVRLTLHPLSKVTSVSRYEYQYSTISMRPDPSSGLSQMDSSTMLSHIIGQNLSWTPLNWLGLQAGFNYVLSTTKTPVVNYTSSVANAQNDYWTVNFNSIFVLDDKTDFDLGCYYYRSANSQNYLANGVPLGTDQRQYSLTATLTRRITQNLRWNLKYAFSHFDDFASGGNFNYDTHLVYSSLQYRF